MTLSDCIFEPVSYRFGDPVDMGDPPSLNLREFGDLRIDLGTPLSVGNKEKFLNQINAARWLLRPLRGPKRHYNIHCFTPGMVTEF